MKWYVFLLFSHRKRKNEHMNHRKEANKKFLFKKCFMLAWRLIKGRSFPWPFDIVFSNQNKCYFQLNSQITCFEVVVPRDVTPHYPIFNSRNKRLYWGQVLVSKAAAAALSFSPRREVRMSSGLHTAILLFCR